MQLRYQKGIRRYRMRLCGVALLGVMVLLPAGVSATSSSYNWLQFNGNAQHSGDNTQETLISTANVGTLHQLFRVTLPDVADGAPAYLSAVHTPSGTKNLLFLTTKDGHILAVNAQTGAQVWVHQNGPGTCHINNGSSLCYTTSSPAVQPSTHSVFTYGLDGYVHKYAVGTGAETKTGGWPELATLKPFDEKGSSALSIATVAGGATYLYMTNGGYPGDQGDYQGHVTAINLATGAQTVFNANCSAQTVHFVEQPGSPDCAQVQSAIWARDGVVYDSATGKIYMATGNGDFNPSAGDWGDSVFSLSPNATGANGGPLDSYTPADNATLNSEDLDLGSTAPAILPAVPATSTVQHLAVQSGKDGLLRLLNLDNLSGQGGPGHTGGEVGQVISVPQGGQVLSAIAVWVNPRNGSSWIFVADPNGISGLRLTVTTGGTPALKVMWQQHNGGFSPLIANGVLYYAGNNTIWALNPTTGATLWHDSTIGGIHWESPIVDNGVLYITDENGDLTAYAPQ